MGRKIRGRNIEDAENFPTTGILRGLKVDLVCLGSLHLR